MGWGGGVPYREYILEEPHLFAVVAISSTFPLPSACNGRLYTVWRKTRREIRIVDIVTYVRAVTAEGGGWPKKTTTKKRGPLPRIYSLYG